MAGPVLAAVYARYSSHSQSEQSIEGQLSAAHAYAEARGYKIVREYCDRAKSGTNDNRAEFQRMLRDSDKHAWQVLITWKIDRIGRNREELAFNKHRLRKNGIQIEYVAESVPDSPEGVILESVLEGMAEYYSLQLAQNIRRGYEESAKEARHFGNIPLGLKVNKDRHYEIDEEKAPIVRLIFEKYASGMTASELVRYLNGQGFTTGKGRPFGRTSLYNILHNEKYIGNYVALHGTVRHEGAIPAIVDKELFDRVQDMMGKNRAAPSSKWSVEEYVLTGKVFCGTCGHVMTGESGTGKAGKKYSYYKCLGNKRRKTCDRKAVPRDRLEDLVIRTTMSILRSEGIMGQIVDAVWDYYCKEDETKNRLEAVRIEMESVEKAKANLIRAVEQGMPYGAVKDRLESLEAQREALESARTQIVLDGEKSLSRDQVEFFLWSIASMDFRDARAERRLVQTFINAVYVFDDHIRICYNFGGREDTIPLDECTGGEDASLSECSDAVGISPLFCTQPNTIRIARGVFIVLVGL